MRRRPGANEAPETIGRTFWSGELSRRLGIATFCLSTQGRASDPILWHGVPGTASAPTNCAEHKEKVWRSDGKFGYEDHGTTDRLGRGCCREA